MMKSIHQTCYSFQKRPTHLISNMQTRYAKDRGPDERSLNKDLKLSTKKMSAYLHEGKFDDARNIFYEMPFRDSIACNIMIRDCVRNGRIEDARDVFDGMPGRNTVSWNSMIMGYSLGRKMHVALKLFIVMPDCEKDIVSWTTTISGLACDFRITDSWKLFKLLPDPNSVSWSAIISGFQQNGLAYETLSLFKEMLSLGTRPTSHSITSALAAAADLSALFQGQQLYCQLFRRGFDSNTHVGNSAISMFMKSGTLDCARNIFYNMPQKDLFTWNSLITGYGHHGFGVEAILAFHQMQRAGFRPDDISFLGVLQGCSHCGFVNEGWLYFDSMQKDFDIYPKPEHYVCLVDILSRAGLLREAAVVIAAMPFEPTAVFWRTLLNGCRIFGELQLGVYVANRILKLESDNAATCLMVIEMYGAVGRCFEMERLRTWMRKREVKRELGYSWIEIKGKAHLFTSRDETHQESDSIYRALELLSNAITDYIG